MNEYGVALALGLCLASTTLLNVFTLSELTWKNSAARPVLITQGVLTLVLIAGFIWNADTQFSGTLFAGWFGGQTLGLGIALWRSRKAHGSHHG